MIWKKQLKQLESIKQWDIAIEFLQKVIEENPNDLDAYLSMNYLLMNLLVEEEHGENFKYYYYEHLLKHYFNESYSKFSNNAEYLFYIGTIVFISEWYVDRTVEETRAMLYEAMHLEPDNILYKYGYYGSLWGAANQLEAYKYAKIILEENSPIKERLLSKGSLGEYILEIMTNWSKSIENELSGVKQKSYLKD